MQRKKKSWIIAVLQKQLWSDTVDDCIVCIGYALFAFMFAGMFILGHLSLWLILAALTLGGLFVIAGHRVEAGEGMGGAACNRVVRTYRLLARLPLLRVTSTGASNLAPVKLLGWFPAK
jgi:hypothetical protein